MNWLDIVIIIVLIASAFWGLKNGLIRWVFTLGGLVLGAVFAGIGHRALAENIFSSLPDGPARIVSFIIIFVAVLVAAVIAGSIVRKVASLLMMGWLDKLGGLVVGVISGALVTAALVVLVARFVALPVDLPSGLGPREMEAFLENWRGTAKVREVANDAIQGSSISHTYIQNFPILLGLLPGEFDAVRDFFQ